jgi:L-alanine-DL-glutamate epimerase-like enolase superfamily enzyme
MDDTRAFETAAKGGVSATIRAVETIPLNVPFDTPFKISSGAPRAVVETLLVRIHTDQGIVGIGETQAWRRQGSAELLPNLVNQIKGQFEPLLIGRSPFDVAAIMQSMNDTLYNSLYAQAAIGDALYDAMGKLLNVPVYQLLGGRCRDRVRVGAVLSMKTETADLIDSAEEFYERGFRHFGLKIGVDPAVDFKNAEALRARFGGEVVLRVDANGAMTFDAALALLKRLEKFDIDAAEQPVALWDIDGLAALARSVAIPIMADECVSTDHSLIDVIRRRAATVVQTKVAKNGGIYYIRRLWDLARAAGMRIYPGNHPSTSVATASVAHMCAAWPDPLMEGVFAVGVSGALAEDVVTNPIEPINGEIPIPTGPGLGVELDEERITALRVDV